MSFKLAFNNKRINTSLFKYKSSPYDKGLRRVASKGWGTIVSF